MNSIEVVKVDPIQEAYDWLFETSDEPLFDLALIELRRVPGTEALQSEVHRFQYVFDNLEVSLDELEEYARKLEASFVHFQQQQEKPDE